MSGKPASRIGDAVIQGVIVHGSATPVKLINEEGRAIWQAEPDDWGAVRNEKTFFQSGIRQPIRFQGQWLDEESGFYYNRYRFYDPRHGRYITQDPIGLEGGDNVYGYVFNPTQWVDPLGLGPDDPSPRGMTYDPTFWNNPAIKNHNDCYSYALNRPNMYTKQGVDIEKPQPGEASGQKYRSLTCRSITAATIRDGDAAGEGIKSVKKNKCPPGYHKIYLVIAPGDDYHWYRQDVGGKWSHKRGNTEAINFDSNNRKITNPETGGRRYEYRDGTVDDYSKQCGVLCAKN